MDHAEDQHTIREWLRPIDRDAKEERNRYTFEMWLACYTQQKIADAVRMAREAVATEAKPFSTIAALARSLSSWLTPACLKFG